jgi:hypothetical protein
MAADKVIVTNVSALRAKYGDKFTRVRAAIDAMIEADAGRDLVTRVVAIDSETDMARVGGKAVTSAHDQAGAKAAVDAIYTHDRPDYIMLLGARDVVPHIHLTNPMLDEGDEEDPDVPSDVPYACDAPFSRRPQDFLGPTRVVGRLPDLTGADEPSYLVKVLTTAAKFVCRDPKEYSTHFALTAKVWRRSTRKSAIKLFGADAEVFSAPPDGPRWTTAQLAPRIHFINCHGNTVSPNFFGEFPKGTFSTALSARLLPAKITKGSVVAAECCYGAELYAPSSERGQMGICNAYLGEGAYGFFGSTTIAYGPSTGQGQADLMCQFFVASVLDGASLGRATLEARHLFVSRYSHTDPSDLKTAVQFLLLGDPSVQPVKAELHAFSGTKVAKRAIKSGVLQPRAREFRRERLVRTGTNLNRTMGAAVPVKARIPARTKRFLVRAANESGIRRPTFKSFRVRFPSTARMPEMANVRTDRSDRWIYIAIGNRKPQGERSESAVTAIIVTMEGRQIVHVRRVHSR